MLSHEQFFVTPWTVAHQAPLSMGFSRQEYWNGLPNPGIKATSLASPALEILYHCVMWEAHFEGRKSELTKSSLKAHNYSTSHQTIIEFSLKY